MFQLNHYHALSFLLGKLFLDTSLFLPTHCYRNISIPVPSFPNNGRHRYAFMFAYFAASEQQRRSWAVQQRYREKRTSPSHNPKRQRTIARHMAWVADEVIKLKALQKRNGHSHDGRVVPVQSSAARIQRTLSGARSLSLGAARCRDSTLHASLDTWAHYRWHYLFAILSSFRCKCMSASLSLFVTFFMVYVVPLCRFISIGVAYPPSDVRCKRKQRWCDCSKSADVDTLPSTSINWAVRVRSGVYVGVCICLC